MAFLFDGLTSNWTIGGIYVDGMSQFKSVTSSSHHNRHPESHLLDYVTRGIGSEMSTYRC